MTEHHGDIPHITSAIVKRLATARRRIYRDPCPAAEEEIPLVAVRVPVQFAHGAGFESYECGGDVSRCGESGGVDDLERAGVRDGERALLRPVVGVLLIGLSSGAGGASGVLLGDVFRRRCAREDVAELAVSGMAGESVERSFGEGELRALTVDPWGCCRDWRCQSAGLLL